MTCGVVLLFAWALSITPIRAATIHDLTPTNGPNSSDSVKLSDLIAGDTIVVGDKEMSGFVYSPIGDMPPADQVNVLGFKDPNNNLGLSFHGTFLDLPGGSFSDAMIRFDVAVDPVKGAGLKITDAHLFLSGVGVGTDSALMVDETFMGTNQSLHTFMSTINGGSTQLTDSTNFVPGVTKLTVTKDVLAMAGANSTLPARVTVIDQSFSQSHDVPEPATFALLLAGVFAFVGLRRNR
ncbi:MAG TPA: PEP-CTERM sorting domain-containing protein [Lacipirellulaceae bacterium]|nr:PEP-CTERM sorting domain-containing protein [Lacipirellulaceae bacterium]